MIPLSAMIVSPSLCLCSRQPPALMSAMVRVETAVPVGPAVPVEVAVQVVRAVPVDPAARVVPVAPAVPVAVVPARAAAAAAVPRRVARAAGHPVLAHPVVVQARVAAPVAEQDLQAQVAHRAAQVLRPVAQVQERAPEQVRVAQGQAARGQTAQVRPPAMQPQVAVVAAAVAGLAAAVVAAQAQADPEPKENDMTTLKAGLVAAIIVATGTVAQAQSSSNSVGQSWNSSYGYPSPTERSVRQNFIVEQEKIKRGFYQAPITTINSTTNTTYDHSVRNNVNAAAGSSVDIENRTAEGTGTSSYAVGAINTSTNNITTDGAGNVISIANAATSDAGCIDGGIVSAGNNPVGGFDISAGSGSSGSGGTVVNNTRGTCR